MHSMSTSRTGFVVGGFEGMLISLSFKNRSQNFTSSNERDVSAALAKAATLPARTDQSAEHRINFIAVLLVDAFANHMQSKSRHSARGNPTRKKITYRHKIVDGKQKVTSPLATCRLARWEMSAINDDRPSPPHILNVSRGRGTTTNTYVVGCFSMLPSMYGISLDAVDVVLFVRRENRFRNAKCKIQKHKDEESIPLKL
jgi:hypothetical protein